MATPDLTNQVSTDITNMQLLLTVKSSDVTTNSTSGTGEDTLATFSLTAGDLNTTGVMEIIGCGDLVGQNANKTVRFYFGSTSWPLFVTNTPGKWQARITVMNVSASSQRVMIESQTSCYGIGPDYTKRYGFYDTASEASASAVTVKFTGECLNASDTINQYMMLARQLKVG